ncbi:MAG: KOW domain-containing RNA-binding protein [Peptostreptococcaceae bacterium]|nr:KOW domain-containing RNA-binding protein [Peptostreptococcaceae bacterium]
MKNVRIGQVVQSISGRDAGYFFLVLAVEEKGFVRIADGKLHKIRKPKRKNIKHLRLLPLVSENIDQINWKDLQSQDAFLRKELKRLGYSNTREG